MTLIWNDFNGSFYSYDFMVSFLVIHIKSGIYELKNYYGPLESKMTYCGQCPLLVVISNANSKLVRNFFLSM